MGEREFARRSAFVPGAPHVQGRAAALAFARAGGRIAAFDIARPLPYPGYELGSADDLRSLQQECREPGAACLTFEGDVRDDGAVTRAVDAAVAEFGRI